ACVKPVASVHPEPGSNSSLLFIFSFFLFFSKRSERQTSLLVIILLSQKPLVQASLTYCDYGGI
ncbi:MAG: hypothetical protein K2I35_01410, partial [Duncaniella sp.]|nr:hypothetical protein [Duncaniella sp.]